MIKNRIIPTLLWKDTGLVKGVKFDSWRRVDTVIPAIRVYNMREVDELILLDVAATTEGREPDYESIKEFSSSCFVPFSVGGGIRTVDHIKKILRSGADKVVVNSVLYDDLELLREGARIFGSQCMIASVDCRFIDGDYYCYSHSGQKKTEHKVKDWINILENNGAGEIIITSIDHDGTMTGYDHELIKMVVSHTTIPVIASGGASSYDDFYQAIVNDGASAVAAASIFHFTEMTPKQAKNYLREKGLNIRK